MARLTRAGNHVRRGLLIHMWCLPKACFAASASKCGYVRVVARKAENERALDCGSASSSRLSLPSVHRASRYALHLLEASFTDTRRATPNNGAYPQQNEGIGWGARIR